MKTSDLLLSSLNITEDDYNYKGLFILSSSEKTIQVDISDLDKDEKMAELKEFFDLEESTQDISKILMEKVFEKAHISSVIIEGKNYDENTKRKKTERLANTFDRA